jgi:hypothetical protein
MMQIVRRVRILAVCGAASMVVVACAGSTPSSTDSGSPTASAESGIASVVTSTIPRPTTTFSPSTAVPTTTPVATVPPGPLPVPSVIGVSTTTTLPLDPPAPLGRRTHLRGPTTGEFDPVAPGTSERLCAEVAAPSWTLQQCEGAGGYFAVVERSTRTSGVRVRLLADTEGSGVWSTVLLGTDPEAVAWDDVVVFAQDVTDDVLPEIWVGYQRFDGRLDVDIAVQRPGRDVQLVADHGLAAGRIVLVRGGYDSFEPVRRTGDAPCCPSGGARRREVRASDPQWIAQEVPPLPPGSPLPLSAFDTAAAD